MTKETHEICRSYASPVRYATNTCSALILKGWPSLTSVTSTWQVRAAAAVAEDGARTAIGSLNALTDVFSPLTSTAAVRLTGRHVHGATHPKVASACDEYVRK